MVDPKLLCRKHLLGEHGEMHKFIPSFRKGHKVDGRFNPVVQIQFQNYQLRHDNLAEEMLRRKMKHKSPLPELPDFKSTYPQHYNKLVDTWISITDLIVRCPECKEKICK